MTKGGHPIRDLVFSNGCSSCSLSNSFYAGYVLINNDWHFTKWDKNGRNLSGIEVFDLIF